MSAEGNRPRVVIGVPLYNGEQFIAEALESLLSQTFTDFAILMLDDGSTDGTEEIARRYATLDTRVTYEKNAQRLGMTRNCTHVFELARERLGDFPYFAWGSDHDVWHPRWLASLVEVLDADPTLSAACPLNIGIADSGEQIREPWHWEVRSEPRRSVRLRTTINGMSAGNMVYSLFRADLLERCEVYRSVLLPDRLLIAELSLYGGFAQVPEILWYRRYRIGVKASVSRQRRSFFPEGIPRWAYLPWPVQHAWFLFRSLVLRGNARGHVNRVAGIGWTAMYAGVSLRYEAGTRWRKKRAPFKTARWLADGDWRRSAPVRCAKQARARGQAALQGLRSWRGGTGEAA